jgi:predicted TIM-barrel fold metal-dependent hydrolase
MEATPMFDIIDGHHHYGNLASSVGLMGPPGQKPLSNDQFDAIELETRLRVLDGQSVRQAVIIGGHAYLRPHGIPDTQAVNDGVARYRDQNISRFPAAVGITEPLYGEEGLVEVDRCKKELGLVGISFHTRFQGVSLESPWVRRYIERIGGVGMVPYLHAINDSNDEALWQIDNLAGDFPDINFLVLDAFSGFDQSRQVHALIDRRPNLFFDTSLAYNFSLITPVIAAHGHDRIVYGSDTYSWPLGVKGSHILDEILASDLSDEAKTAILGGNLRKLLGLD